MKFHIDPKHLKTMLKRVRRTVKRDRSYQPLVVIDADESGARMTFASTTCTGSSEVRTERFPAAVEKPGAACIEHEFVAGLKPKPKKPLTFEVVEEDPQNKEIAGPLLVVDQGNYHRASSIKDRPDVYENLLVDDNWNEPRVMSMSISELKRGLLPVKQAMAKQDVRFFLNGMWVSRTKNEVCFVATDGHRIADCEFKMKGPDFEETLIFEDVVHDIAATLSEMDDDGAAIICRGNQTVGVELTDNDGKRTVEFVEDIPEGRCPLWRKIVEFGKPPTLEITGDREGMLDAIEAVVDSPKKDSLQVTIKPDILRVEKWGGDTGSVDLQVSGHLDWEKGEATLGFSAAYLKDAMSDIDAPRFRMRGVDEKSVFLVDFPDTPGARRGVMPRRAD